MFAFICKDTIAPVLVKNKAALYKLKYSDSFKNWFKNFRLLCQGQTLAGGMSFSGNLIKLRQVIDEGLLKVLNDGKIKYSCKICDF